MTGNKGANSWYNKVLHMPTTFNKFSTGKLNNAYVENVVKYIGLLFVAVLYKDISLQTGYAKKKSSAQTRWNERKSIAF